MTFAQDLVDVLTGRHRDKLCAQWIDAICLHLQVVGGGNYVEHQSLQDWAQNSGRQVTCNDLVERILNGCCSVSFDEIA